MLELIDCDIEGAVAWRLGGTITDDDMHLALDAVRSKLLNHEKVSVYQEILDFGGVELDAVMEKLRFLSEFGVSHFRRIAVVTDKQWMHKVIAWEDRIFSKVSMRAFTSEERERAFNFLAYGDDPDSSPATV